jgi:hypothetical protein
MATAKAHIYRTNRPGIPRRHADVILSKLPWQIVHGNQRNGWSQWAGGFNDADAALLEARQLWGCNVVLHA